ncbi:fibronectin type III domain-containing protein [Kutzneria buriramensis]|uniref:Fibronectin type III domain protein n=1 Tax=Kutzneria buriramensis TaxID=1045776 RepID=A0A3E0HIW8_9PSEU|nr:fibronectin type III domain-containing protein [Kutzneria buriramensis]REH46290.1 fibronectin type III domain protein [Kutzneria buriramensis]
MNRLLSCLYSRLGCAVAVVVGILVVASMSAASPNTTLAAASSPAWTGTFDNFHTSSWNSSWGLTSDSAQCKGATSTAPCNWGYNNLQPVSDPTAPGGGQALKVTYPAPSGPPSCGCGLGGGQFYQDLASNGQSVLATSPTLDLKYYYKFPVGFDFGKKTAGKMPGLYGGQPGCESGGQHCGTGWSTRYMWRGGSSSAPKGELYFYTASGSGFGADLCLGNWTFPADGNWHSIEQLVNVKTGQISIWSDGGTTPVCQTTQPLPGAFSGVFFSTFHGGHDTSWSPTHTTTDEFADFTLDPNPQNGTVPSTPATPTNAVVTGTTSSSISLSWTEPSSQDPAASYRIYEGSTVVASPTSTAATITGLPAGSSHTYTVSAVDSASHESGRSAPVTGSTSGGTPTPATPVGLTVTGTTSSSISLSWAEPSNADSAVSYKVYDGSTVVVSPTTTTATITGLAPGTSHTYTVTAVDAAGTQSPPSGSATGTTTGGGGGNALTVAIAKTKDWGSGYTDQATITNHSGAAVTGWNVQFDLDPSMNIETVSNATLTTNGNHQTLTNTSSDATIPNDGNATVTFSGDYGSAYVAPTNVTVNGQGGGNPTPATPKGLTVAGTTTSTISISWTEPSGSDPAVSYDVFEGQTLVTTSSSTSATVTGLAAGSSHTYTIAAVDAAGNLSPNSAPVTASTQSGSNGPATPTGLAVTGTTTSSISLSWTEPSGSDPAASYKVYEGGNLVTTATTTSATVTGLAPGSSHTYVVTAVDGAGVESGPSGPVSATTQSSGGTAFSQTEIDSAVAAAPIAFAKPISAVPRPGTNPVVIGSAKVLEYLALVDKQQPGAKSTGGTTVDSALLGQVRHLIAGGNEPDADGGLEGWAHAPVAQGLLLLKNGPAWGELTSTEQNKVSLLEAAMGYAGNYTYNDANNFSSGICGFGNFAKGNNPNYRDGYVDVEAAAIQFFGASAWDSMLTGFDDATEASQLNAAGLTNAGGCFATVGTAANSAIRRAFVYSGVHSSDLMGLWNTLAAATFDQTVTSVNGPAHIADGTTSPVQGKLGMGHEFNSTDSQGLRSSALYTFEGWMNVTGDRLAMTALGGFSCSAATAAARYDVGSTDLIYKLHHGYVSHALNQNNILVDDHGDPATDGPNVKGYQYDLDAYHVLIANQGC